MREKLIEMIRKADKEDHESLTQDVHYAFMADRLLESGVTIPIRCKECKYWWKANNLCTNPKCCDGNVAVVDAPSTHFCSYGERRTDA